MSSWEAQVAELVHDGPFGRAADLPPLALSVAGVTQRQLPAPQARAVPVASLTRVLSAFGAHASPALRPPDPSLTPRKLEVLKLVGWGLANSEVAGELCISEVAVRAHLGHVLSKLSLRDRPRPSSAIQHRPGHPGG